MRVIVRYFLGWFGMVVLAVLNGGLRDILYKSDVGDLPAHQISTVLLLIIFAAYFRLLTSLWPIRSSGEAWTIGFMWLVMTLTFEIVMVRFIAGNPWSTVLHDYNILAGRVWVLIPLWTLIGPYVFFRLGKAP